MVTEIPALYGMITHVLTALGKILGKRQHKISIYIWHIYTKSSQEYKRSLAEMYTKLQIEWTEPNRAIHTHAMLYVDKFLSTFVQMYVCMYVHMYFCISAYTQCL